MKGSLVPFINLTPNAVEFLSQFFVVVGGGVCVRVCVCVCMGVLAVV